jgi:hypothetical protein
MNGISPASRNALTQKTVVILNEVKNPWLRAQCHEGTYGFFATLRMTADAGYEA